MCEFYANVNIVHAITCVFIKFVLPYCSVIFIPNEIPIYRQSHLDTTAQHRSLIFIKFFFPILDRVCLNHRKPFLLSSSDDYHTTYTALISSIRISLNESISIWIFISRFIYPQQKPRRPLYSPTFSLILLYIDTCLFRTIRRRLRAASVYTSIHVRRGGGNFVYGAIEALITISRAWLV